MIANTEHRARIAAHYRANWGTAGHQIDFVRGPIYQLPPDFGVLEFVPTQRRRMWTYATCCMSQPDDRVPLELHMFSLDRNKEIVEVLVATAHYHGTGETLDLGHTVNFGRSWIEGSKCDFGLVSLPYLDGPKLEKLNVDGEQLAAFYWLVPVTKSEVEFKKHNGVEALEAKLEGAAFNYLDPHRKPVV